MKCEEEEEEEEELEAARSLLLLCNRSASNHFPSADLQNPISMSLKKSSSSFFLQPWGFRSKRSSCACSRPSPSTPLDFRAVSYDPSTSGSSESFHTCSDFAFVKRLCTSDASASRSEIDVAKFSEVERFPLVEAALTSSKPIRRQGRKKTVAELQAQEKSLREEKTVLMKLVESKRKDVETLIAEHESLKGEMAIFQRARATTEAAKPAAFLLPDLNEPLLMESLVT